MVGIGHCSVRGCDKRTNKNYCRDHRVKTDREKFRQKRREQMISYKVVETLKWIHKRFINN